MGKSNFDTTSEHVAQGAWPPWPTTSGLVAADTHASRTHASRACQAGRTRLDCAHARFLDVALAEAAARSCQFDAQGAANMVWPMRVLKLKRMAFLAASWQQAVIMLEAGEHEGQSLSNILRSFATATPKPQPLLASLVQIFR